MNNSLPTYEVRFHAFPPMSMLINEAHLVQAYNDWLRAHGAVRLQGSGLTLPN